MSGMKKSLRKLDNFMVKDQEKRHLKLTAELDIQQVTLAPLDSLTGDDNEHQFAHTNDKELAFSCVAHSASVPMSPVFKRAIAADDKDYVADPKMRHVQSGHERLGQAKATGTHIPHLGMALVQGHRQGGSPSHSETATPTLGAKKLLIIPTNDKSMISTSVHYGANHTARIREEEEEKRLAAEAKKAGRPSTAHAPFGKSTSFNFFQAAQSAMEQDEQYRNEFTTADSMTADHQKCNAFAETYEMNSPRAVFLSGCLEYDIPPRSNVLLRSKVSSILDLSNQGLTDQLGLLLAESLSNNNMPAVTSILIPGNDQLTDVSLPSILNAVISNPTITELDISNLQLFNTRVHCDSDYNICILQPLVSYLSKRYCPLRKLNLGNCYLEDRDCGKLVDALLHNHNFEALDLSHNRLGMNEEVSGAAKASSAKETKAKATTKSKGKGGDDAAASATHGGANATAGHANIFSGGELMGSLVRAPTCPLTTLKLSYNMIHGLGAIDLCDSIKHSKTLNTLDLSYNDIGAEGAMSLGAALIGNKVLRHLNVGHNRIGAEGMLVLCVGVRESVVTELNIDGNPIGSEGARMVMSLAISKGADKHVTITSTSCDAQPFPISKGLDMRVVVDKEKAKGHDASGLAKKFLPKQLDLANPVGFYSLSMSSVIGRAMLFELLFRISSSSNIEVTSFEYSSAPVTAATASTAAPKRSSFVGANSPAARGTGEKILRKTEKIPLDQLDPQELALMEKYKLHVAVAKKMSSASSVRETLTVRISYLFPCCISVGCTVSKA